MLAPVQLPNLDLNLYDEPISTARIHEMQSMTETALMDLNARISFLNILLPCTVILGLFLMFAATPTLPQDSPPAEIFSVTFMCLILAGVFERYQSLYRQLKRAKRLNKLLNFAPVSSKLCETSLADVSACRIYAIKALSERHLILAEVNMLEDTWLSHTDQSRRPSDPARQKLGQAMKPHPIEPVG